MTHTQTRSNRMPLEDPPPRTENGRKARGGAPSAKEILATKKRFLSCYGDNERELRRLEEEISRWESRAERMTSSFSHAPAYRGEDRIQSAVDEMVELRNLLYERLVDATELRRCIGLAISTVPEQRLRLLLEYRYIDGLTWEEVAAMLTCDYRWTLRLHDRALALMVAPDSMPFYG